MEDQPNGAQPEDPAAPVAAPDELTQAHRAIERLVADVDQAHEEKNKAIAECRLEIIKNEALNAENIRLRMENEILVSENASLREGRERDQQTIAHLAAEWEEQQRTAYERLFDPLTGLHSLKFFDERVGDFFIKEKRTVRCAYGFVDLAKFKEINDTLGHPAGDDALRQVAGIISSIRESHHPGESGRRYLPRKGEHDIAARIGDEFTFFVSQIAEVEHCRYLAHRMVKRISQISISNQGSTRTFNADIGIVTFVFSPESTLPFQRQQLPFQLRRWADYYMYKAKNYSKSQGDSAKLDSHYSVKDLHLGKILQEPPVIDKTGR
jgi:diguanylate cyclase (GGDEF)-like protein